MLNAPADRELRMASENRNTAMPASFSEPANDQPQPGNQGQQNGTEFSNIVSQPQQVDQPQQPDGNKNPSAQMFPLVLAWVLLSGSGAGNLYMIWSYLDIRSKYRGLVRSAGRKLGRRYLDDRYGEPEYDE